jgi:hypothetical protein
LASTLFFRKGKMPLSTIHQQISYCVWYFVFKVWSVGFENLFG